MRLPKKNKDIAGKNSYNAKIDNLASKIFKQDVVLNIHYFLLRVWDCGNDPFFVSADQNDGSGLRVCGKNFGTKVSLTNAFLYFKR